MWLGKADSSGSYHTSIRFLESAGVARHQIENLGQNRSIPFAELNEAFHKGFREETSDTSGSGKPLDVAMVMTVPGSPLLCQGIDLDLYQLFSLDYESLRYFTIEQDSSTDGNLGGFHDQIIVSQIPSTTYPKQAEEIPTVAVPVLLLTHSDLDQGIARKVRQRAQSLWQEMVEAKPTSDCKLPSSFPRVGSFEEAGMAHHVFQFDSGSSTVFIAHLAPLWQWLRSHRRPLIEGLGLLFLVTCVWLGWRQGIHWWLLRKIQTRFLPTLITFTVSSVFLITLTTHLLERRNNEHFSNLGESFWSITVYIFSGLEDRTPYTPEGRAIATLGLILGPLVFALLTGWLARLFIHMEKNMPHNLKNHFLILNWNDRAMEILQQLHHPLIRERDGTTVVVILTDDQDLTIKHLQELGSGQLDLFEDVFLSIGDATQERALLNANAQDARAILVLSEEKRGPEASDGRTLRSLIMLRRIAQQHDRSLHVVAELLEPGNDPVLEDLARDFPGMLEWISGIQVRTCLIAQAALSQGIIELYQNLLRVSEDTNEIYLHPIPSQAVGRSFHDYSADVVRKTASRQPLIPLGLQREVDGRRRMFCNPKSEEPGATLEVGDQLVILAHEPPERDALLDV
jgi:hypothetical protein